MTAISRITGFKFIEETVSSGTSLEEEGLHLQEIRPKTLLHHWALTQLPPAFLHIWVTRFHVSFCSALDSSSDFSHCFSLKSRNLNRALWTRFEGLYRFRAFRAWVLHSRSLSWLRLCWRNEPSSISQQTLFLWIWNQEYCSLCLVYLAWATSPSSVFRT